MKTIRGGKRGGSTRTSKSRNLRVTRRSGQITPVGLNDLLVDSSDVLQHHNDDGTTSVTWTPESEIILFKAMIEYKLVGIKKHFNVITVADLLSKKFGFKVDPANIWEHVNSMYKQEELEENKSPVIYNPSDFSLPKSYDSLKSSKFISF